MKKIIFLFFLLILTLLVAEVALRFVGFDSYNTDVGNSKIKSDPSPLFAPHYRWGYNYIPGFYKVHLNDALTYNIKIDVDSSRKVIQNKKTSNASIYLFGCSFFGGMGVNDTQVVSQHLVTLLDSFQVKNYSIPGHGLTTQFLILKQKIEEGLSPDVAVFSTASFHLLRNPASLRYTYSFGAIEDAPSLFPAARLTKNQSLKFSIVQTRPPGLWLAKHSALYFQLLLLFDRVKYPLNSLLLIHNHLSDEIFSLCLQHNIQPVFVLISNDLVSDSLQAFYIKRNYPFFKSKVNYRDTAFNLMPVDGHPNQRAHHDYAVEIADFINTLR